MIFFVPTSCVIKQMILPILLISILTSPQASAISQSEGAFSYSKAPKILLSRGSKNPNVLKDAAHEHSPPQGGKERVEPPRSQGDFYEDEYVSPKIKSEIEEERDVYEDEYVSWPKPKTKVAPAITVLIKKHYR